MRSKHLIILTSSLALVIASIYGVATNNYNVEIIFSLWTLSLLIGKLLFQPHFVKPTYMKNVDTLLIISIVIFALIVLRHTLDAIAPGLE